MGFFKKLFSKAPEQPKIEKSDEYVIKLTGKEDECEYCHRPIFRATEQWTKLQGHYFHRSCWKEGVKKNKTFG